MSKIWSSRKLIVYIVAVSTAVAVVVSLLMPNYYRAMATLLPDTEKGKLASLGGVSELVSLAGLNMGEPSLVKLYPRIIVSEAVLRNVIYVKYHTEKSADSVTLSELWNVPGDTHELIYERTLNLLRDLLDVSMDNKTNVVSIAVETKDPLISAAIVNNITSELDKFIRTKKTTSAGEERRWVEARLAEVKNDLEKSENALKGFREKNRRVIDSPELLLEQERMMREVQINTALYTELKKQYEVIKIEEIKNIPIITIMDPAYPPALKERPHRSVIVMTVFFISIAAALGYVFAIERYGQSILGFWLFLKTLKGKL